MYSLWAMELRRCHAKKGNGTPCRAWAVWGDWRRLCVRHGGQNPNPPGPHKGHYPTRCEPCRCEAYAWPHRPGGGLCRWPDPPQQRCTTTAGTRDWPRPRSKKHRALVRSLKQADMMIKRAEALSRRASVEPQLSPSEAVAEALRLLVVDHRNNNSQPLE